MKYKLIVPGLLPGLNDYTKANRTSCYAAAEMKNQAEYLIGLMIRSQMRAVRITKPVVINYNWVEANMKRDKDNISFAKKFVQDALVKTKVLKNDGWKEVESFSDRFSVDRKKPRVEIEIIEVE